MNVLAIDTVTQACSVALLTDSESFQEAKFEANQHSAFVLDMVDSVLQQADLTLANVDLLAVNNGPGSFTGIRIGVGVAQGLAYGADIPVIGINSLAVLAAQTKGEGPILSMIDARMGQVYWACFSDNLGTLSTPDWQAADLHLTKPDEIKTFRVTENSSIIACGCEHYLEQFAFDSSSDALSNTTSFDAFPMAIDLAKLAVRVGSSDYQSAQTLTPVYLRNNVASVSTKKRL